MIIDFMTYYKNLKKEIINKKVLTHPQIGLL